MSILRKIIAFSASAVVVGEFDDVVEIVGGDFEDFGVFQSFGAVDFAGVYVELVTGVHEDFVESVNAVAEVEFDFAGHQVLSFLLFFVVLQRIAVAFFEAEDFAHVFGLHGEPEFLAPGLEHFFNWGLIHFAFDLEGF